MRLDRALRQLPEIRFFSGFRIHRCHEDGSDVCPEFLAYQSIILLVCDAEQVLLRRRCKLQADRRIRDRADISLDQPANRFLQP